VYFYSGDETLLFLALIINYWNWKLLVFKRRVILLATALQFRYTDFKYSWKEYTKLGKISRAIKGIRQYSIAVLRQKI